MPSIGRCRRMRRSTWAPSASSTRSSARVPFGIVTNGSRYQLHTIQALGLDSRTPCILVSELVGCRKPDAAIFAAAATRLGVPPGAVLFVGDKPRSRCVGRSSRGHADGVAPAGAGVARDDRGAVRRSHHRRVG